MNHKLLVIFLILISMSACQASTGSDINNGIDADVIIKTINKGKPVLIQDKIISGDLDFTKIQSVSVFSTSQKIASIDVPVTFLKCIFLGKVITNAQTDKAVVTTHFKDNLTFEGCDFRAVADFSNSEVDGMVNFTAAVFNENAFFNNMNFGGSRNYFTSCRAEKNFSMQEAVIAGSCDFFQAQYKGKLSFQSTCFGGTAQFSNLKSLGKSDFSLTVFRNNVLFTYAEFGNEFRFSDSRCMGNCDLVSVSFAENALICNSLFYGSVNLNNTTPGKNLDLSGTFFAAGKPQADGLRISDNARIITENTKFGVAMPY